MRTIVWTLAAMGLMAAAACGRADKESNGVTTTTTTTSSTTIAELPFNVGLCQTGLDAKKGANSTVPPGGCLISPAKTFAMVMTASGEVKVASVSPAGVLGPTIWSTGTHATTAGSSSVSFQEDGNLVIYDQPGNKPTWASASTGPLEDYHLALSDGGELLATQVSTGKTIWSSKTGLVKPTDAPASVDATPTNTGT